MASEHPLFVAGRWERPGARHVVVNPYDRSAVGYTWLAGPAEFEAAASAAVAAAPVMRALPTFERAAILARAAVLLSQQREVVGHTLAGEAGKPLRDALTEVDRAAMTFHVASEEARRLGGEVIPLDLAAHGTGRLGIVRRFPIGPVAAISPFNFPLNLSAHKLAPAVAAGNPIVLKPATKTPLSALFLAAVLEQAGLPAGALSVLPMPRDLGDRLVTDDRFKLLTFTGSSSVGWAMKARAGKKKVILELGGNAGVIVEPSADLAFAARRTVTGGFAFAGQSCISVQRVFVHDAIYDTFAQEIVRRVDALVVGDPLDLRTDVGPMIDTGEVDRIAAWVDEAVAAGARVLTGGRRLSESVYAPTVMDQLPEDAHVCAQEVFAPLIGLFRYHRVGDAIAAVNRSRYGLQAGIFTSNLHDTLDAYEALEVGGVLVNDVPTWRIDHMPYGGVKDSGIGREGPRYTIEEMTEPKLLVINREIG